MLGLAYGSCMLREQVSMLHLSFTSYVQEMSRTYAGEIITGAPAVVMNSMAC